MTISQGVQRLHFALEAHTRAPDAEATQLARLTVAGIAARRVTGDPVSSTRLVLEALGLAMDERETTQHVTADAPAPTPPSSRA